MPAPVPLSRSDLDRALFDGEISNLRLIHAAIGTSPVLLIALAALFAVLTPTRPEAGAAPLLSLVALALTAVCWPLSALLPARLLAARAARGSALELIAGLRTARIVRLALLEAPALLGGLALLVGALAGGLPARPLLWANALPYLGLLGYVATRFPSRPALLDEAERALTGRSFAPA